MEVNERWDKYLQRLERVWSSLTSRLINEKPSSYREHCNILLMQYDSYLVMYSSRSWYCVRRLIIYLSFSPVMDLIQAAFYTHLPAYDVCTKRITNYILNGAGQGEMVANMRIFSLRSFSRRSQYSLWRFKIKAAKAERVQALLVSLLNSLPLLLLFVQVLLHILTSRSCG